MRDGWQISKNCSDSEHQLVLCSALELFSADSRTAVDSVLQVSSALQGLWGLGVWVWGVESVSKWNQWAPGAEDRVGARRADGQT